MLLVPVAGLLK